MSTRIRILSENLTNKIAAGEVVERPSSVVKELVENSLDAGCREIVVEVEGGGRRLIRVSDDGEGMSREDALLSLERHATSKIATDEDIFSLTTLGFRGEALPSIASVSRLTLSTRPRGALEGTEIYAEGGRIREVKACGMAEGTVVTVRNLFFNTPARLKFMKSAETEAGHVGDLLLRLAMSRPDVRFTYLNDGKVVFRALNGTMEGRVAELLGRQVTAALHPLDATVEGITIRGLVARPEVSRSSPSHLYTFINGRFIRDRVVQHAVLQAYRNFLERGRYPVVVLFIGMSPGDVDVNVHPTKHEVRFRNQGIVHDVIQGVIEETLRSTPWLHGEKSRSVAPTVPRSGYSSAAGDRVAEVRELLVGYRPASAPAHSFYQPHRDARDTEPVPMAGEATGAGERGPFSTMSVIGQYLSSYILCQDGTDLVIIDQHAAHERVVFERLRKQFADGGVEVQCLLFPETVEFSHREAAELVERREELHRLGFELEEFGGTTWVVKGIPRILSGMDYLRILRDAIEEFLSIGANHTIVDAIEEILSRIACHSVLRGEHPLTSPQIEALLTQMDATDFSTNCPHGRPVLQRITLAEVERMFKRQ